MAVVFFNRNKVRLLPFAVFFFSAAAILFTQMQAVAAEPQSENVPQNVGNQTEPSQSFDELAAKANSSREQGNSEAARRYYEAALKLRPDWPDGWWYLGSIQADTEHYSDAALAFKKLIELRAEFGPGWASLGLCEFENHKYNDSFSHLQRAQELGLADVPSEDKATTYHLALLLNKRADFEDAWELLASKFGKGILPEQAKLALALALMRVPLLPDEIDPSKDALLDAAGETAAFLVQGNFDQALLSFQHMLKDYPGTPFLHYAYGSALMFRSQYEQAEQELRAETRITPSSALPYMRLAVVALKTNRVAQALPDAERAAELAPNSAMAHEIMARIWTELGNKERSEAESTIATKLKPEKPETDPAIAAAYVNRSTVYIDRKRPDAWVELALSEFAGKDYRNSYLHLERGRELGYKGNAQQMTVAVTRLAELRNVNGDFFGASELLIPEARLGRLSEEMKIVLGMSMLRIPLLSEQVGTAGKPLLQAAGETAALLYSGRYDDAFRGFEQMLKYYPGTPFVNYAYASALETLSRYEEAERHLHQEIKITPQNPLSYMRLASIELKQRRPEQALDYATRAVQLDFQEAGGHELTGRALLEMGKLNDAIKELETARQLAPNYPEVHFNLARAYTKAKLKAEAARERALFAQLNAEVEQEKSSQAQAYGAPQNAPEPPSLAREPPKPND